MAKYNREYYLAHRAEIIARTRRWQADHPDYGKGRKRHPPREQVNAKGSINYYVRCGKVVRPTICTVCREQKPIQAHHPDHTKPLAVVWSCQDCHFKLETGLINTEPWMVADYSYLRQRLQPRDSGGRYVKEGGD
uniref:Uncharacterized protein n=1 Tax=viral metagenome TaxID=1070528 RepID=A0A6M3LCY9_9ZZZZ